jgi:hypothetical protein
MSICAEPKQLLVSPSKLLLFRPFWLWPGGKKTVAVYQSTLQDSELSILSDPFNRCLGFGLYPDPKPTT